MVDAAQSDPDTKASVGPLPEWNLTNLYPGHESDALGNDLDAAAQCTAAFKVHLEGRVGDLSGTELGNAIAEYERLDEVMGRIMSYAQLVYAGDMSNAQNGKFYQSMQERVTDITRDLLFFTLEINRIEDADLEEKMSAPELAHYQPWLRDVRIFRPHQLSNESEKMLHEKSVTGRAAWVRLFEETVAGLRFAINGKDLTMSEALDQLSHNNAAVREATAREIGRVLAANEKLFALVTNTLAKDKQIEDRWRNYPRPVSFRNRVNQVEDKVVEALVDAVTSHYEPIAHRYYALKAKWFGVDRLNYWDRNAPLPEDHDAIISWETARNTVLEAYHAFDPTMAEIGQRFFAENWIDARPRPGKTPGAFSHPTVPSAHPYILLNYQGKTRDVMTLAHELGHGVHQMLAAKQGHLMSDTPLTLAETASVFGEMLTFRAMLEARGEPGQRRVMLATKVEDMINTVIRQIAFHQFESQIHDQRVAGELTPNAIADIWMRVQGNSLGPSINFDDDYRPFWSYIGHFIHAPFYVYAYAFGDCLVNSLYAVYQDAEQGFSKKYLDMLAAGGTLRHRELLAPFGLNASDPEFWAKGLAVIEGFIDELEAMG